MRPFKSAGLLIAFLLLPCTGSGLHFKGLLFSDLGLNHYHAGDWNDEARFRGLSSLRLTFLNANRQHGKIECNVDLNLPHGQYLDPFINQTADSAISGQSLIALSNGPPLYLDIRKLYLSVYLPFVDLTVGRQIINFGKGVLFSPIDVFSSIELADLAFRRSGSDIALCAFPLGDRSGVDIVAELPYRNATHSTAIKGFTTLVQWDLSVVGIYRSFDPSAPQRREMIAGCAFKGDLEAGVYGELVAHATDQADDVSFEAMAGADYSIREWLLFMAEYLYREHGLQGIWGEHNASGTVQYRINDITFISGTIIQNVSRDLTMGILQYSYNILQNSDLIVYVRGFRGSPLYDAEYAVRVQVKF
jgi:hypothetical protein